MHSFMHFICILYSYYISQIDRHKEYATKWIIAWCNMHHISNGHRETEWKREREPRNRSRSRSLGAAHTNKTHDLNWRERERGRARRRMQNIMYWMASHTVVLWYAVQCVSLSICRWCDHLSVWRTHFSLTFSLLSLALLIYSFNVSFCFFS